MGSPKLAEAQVRVFVSVDGAEVYVELSAENVIEALVEWIARNSPAGTPAIPAPDDVRVDVYTSYDDLWGGQVRWKTGRAYLATLDRERDAAMTTHPDSDRRE